jgi:mannonate dehydratase
MRLASVLTPLSDENLQLAAQAGVDDVVVRCPGPDLSVLQETRERIEAHGLRMSVMEGRLPIHDIQLGRDDGTQLAQMKELITYLGEVGISVLCYNFMPGTDWARTRTDVPGRGGSKVTAFELDHAQDAATSGVWSSPPKGAALRHDELWSNLEAFLTEVIPVAEQAGVTLAMHPDDPPLPALLGQARIMNSVEAFERLVTLVPSPSNAIGFCQGTFSEMGVDIPATIRRLSQHIAYVHFRDVRGSAGSFVESWHDDGQTDMVAAMRAYRDIGFDGMMRPDHVPQMAGEDDGTPGYTMLGRLYAYGYIRALFQATDDH